MDDRARRDAVVLAFLFALFAQLADYTTTVVGLRLGAAEANPIIRYILEHAGNGGFLLAKVLVAVLLMFTLRVNVLFYMLINGMFFWVAYQNMGVIEQLLASR